MICVKCKTLVLVGEKCGSCGQTLAVFTPPPCDFDKKGELYKLSLELREERICDDEFEVYLLEEIRKLEGARKRLRDGDEPLLEEGFQCWERALNEARDWLKSRLDFQLQSALGWATQADLKINQSIQENFERSRDQMKAFQAELRLQNYQPPEENPWLVKD